MKLATQITRRGVIALGSACLLCGVTNAQDNRYDKLPEKHALPNLLKDPKAAEAAEELADQILAQLAISDAQGKAGDSFKSRCSTQPVIIKAQPGLAFSREESSVRKFYIHNHYGECEIKFYNSKDEYDRGQSPFSSFNVVPGQEGKLFYQSSNSRRVYARVETLKAPHMIYIHMEWYC